MNPYRDMKAHAIVEARGWNEESQLIHAVGFIHAVKLDEEFRAYLADVAQEEALDAIDVG